MTDQPLAGRRRTYLSDGWELAAAEPDSCSSPSQIDGLNWAPAQVPGTAAGALPEWDGEVDAVDWWFRVRFATDAVQPGEEMVLHLEGLATVAEVYLDGERVLDSESMFAAHELDIGRLLRPGNELAVCCRALAPRLQGRRRPRARWRTGLVANANLRFYRTMLLGRTPGFAPGPAVVGPWAGLAEHSPVGLPSRSGCGLRGHGGRGRSVHGAVLARPPAPRSRSLWHCWCHAGRASRD